MAVYDWYGWTGAAGGSVIASYLKAKTKPITSRMDNGQLAKLAYIGAQIFQIGQRGRNNMAEMVDGASEYAVGSLVGDFVASKLGIVTIATAAPAAAPAAVTASATSGTASAPSGTPVGVPASGGTSAFDLPVPGY